MKITFHRIVILTVHVVDMHHVTRKIMHVWFSIRLVYLADQIILVNRSKVIYELWSMTKDINKNMMEQNGVEYVRNRVVWRI